MIINTTQHDDYRSLLLTPSDAETLVFWVSQPLPWPVAPKGVPLMTRRGDLKLSHGTTAKARENAVKQDRVPTTNAIKSPRKAWVSVPDGVYRRDTSRQPWSLTATATVTATETMRPASRSFT